MNYEEYESYNDMYYDDTYEDEAIIEAALDIYDEYDVSMEEAIDIAMEKVVYTPGGYKAKKLLDRYGDTRLMTDAINNEYWQNDLKDVNFRRALRNVKNRPAIKEKFHNEALRRVGDYGHDIVGKPNANRKIKFKDTVIDRGNPAPSIDIDPTPIKRRINPKTGIAVGAGAAALGAGGVALYKYHKKKLAEAAKAEKEAEELDSRAARKREKAQKAIAQAKEAASFDYDY